MDFKNYFEVTSGTAVIHYPFTILFRRTYPLSIQAENLAVEPRDELKKALGDQRVLFDRISAKFVIQPSRKVEIEFLDAESKTIQFHLGAKGVHET